MSKTTNNIELATAYVTLTPEQAASLASAVTRPTLAVLEDVKVFVPVTIGDLITLLQSHDLVDEHMVIGERELATEAIVSGDYDRIVLSGQSRVWLTVGDPKTNKPIAIDFS